MKLAVIGSRTFNNQDLLNATLNQFPMELIISGGARGADSMAAAYARHFNIPLKVFPADWDKWGKQAGYLRNKDIIAACDEVVAFWDGTSRGTAHSLKLAREWGKKITIVKF